MGRLSDRFRTVGKFVLIATVVKFGTSWMSSSARGEVEGRADPSTAVVALISRDAVACTGVLIAPKVLLTARHCVGVEYAIVRASSQRLRIVRHQVPPNPAVDAALLFLEAITKVAPIELRSAKDASAPGEVRVVGFGQKGVSALAAPREFRARVRGWGCDADSASARGCSPGLELVLPRRGGLDTCQGDSGGPVLEGDEESGFRVVAITSRAVRDSILRCGDGGIYVRVDALAPWIAVALKDVANGGKKEDER